MNTKSRIASVLKASDLDSSITGIQSFHLSGLVLDGDLDFSLPTNIRLGHLVERIVSGLIKSSKNYTVVGENIQIIKEKRTIGELDFIIENIDKKELIHLELAYKFYLLDPNISSEPIKNWLGPNRNDSLHEKLEKLKTKQFPLLRHSCTETKLNTIELNKVSQALCLLVSLFIPYEYKEQLNQTYTKAIKGYYINFEQFIQLNDSQKSYYLPSKKEWGMDASENEKWSPFESVKDQISTNMHERQAPMCWQKHNGTYLTFFIVWW